ncbi:MAG: hypothetical protein HYY90_05420 [Candidatus Omnitrophica bacterium]|nr:hypothetical protein [Candidatus Omnitrophota bacterium]MBI3083783.1 hypothetical protein [Candidatus Omnitrophota bacterium]
MRWPHPTLTTALGACVVAVVSGEGRLWAADALAWEIHKSDHFIVYSREAPDGYIEGLIARAEAYYDDITGRLGFTRFDGFWTWDQRARIYLYRDRQEYQDTTRQPEWSEAGSDVREREIHTYVGMAEFYEKVLPHELGHIIFREFIGYQRVLPLWLDEGIACFLEDKGNPTRLMSAKALVTTERFIPFETLADLGGEGLGDAEAFYAEAASVFEFLFQRYGGEKFVDYCRRLRDKQNWEAALKKVYGFESLSAMNAQWVAFLKEDAP